MRPGKVFAKARNFFIRLLGIITGSIIYRVIVALVIFSGMPSDDLKLMTAVVVVVALAFTNYRPQITRCFSNAWARVTGLFSKKEKGDKN